MARLGAKRTVKGYLDEVAANALLWNPSDGVIPDQVCQNWDRIIEGLTGKWRPDRFNDSLSSFHRKHGWSYTSETSRGALGRRFRSTYCYPSIVDLVHRDFNQQGDACWSERGLSVQGWKVQTTPGKATIQVIPSPIIFCSHALERIYERTGGIDYEKFPELIGNVTDTILDKFDQILINGLFFLKRDNARVAAFPIMDGLAVIEINPTYMEKTTPQLGVELRFRRGEISIGLGAARLPEWDADATEDDPISTTFSYVVRTYYGPDELEGKRAESLYLLDMLAERFDHSEISLYKFMEAQNPLHLNDSRHRSVDHKSIAFKLLVADAKESLTWLDTQRDDVILVYGEGRGAIAAKAISEKNSHLG